MTDIERPDKYDLVEDENDKLVLWPQNDIMEEMGFECDKPVLKPPKFTFKIVDKEAVNKTKH